MLRRTLPTVLLVACAAVGCARAPAAPEGPTLAIDTARIMSDLHVLAADSMEGRAMGTEGAARARRFIVRQFEAAGVQPAWDDYEQPFEFYLGEVIPGVNLVGVVEGVEEGGPVMVVTAHYDHLGISGGEIYNGADDNASGVVALLALARHLAENPPRHSVILAALDGEELGLRGAHAFLANPPVPQERMALEINLDMVSRSERGELYAAGAHHYPFLRPHLRALARTAPLRLRLGHDSPDLPRGEDWTQLSDHGPFHRAGIPFVYFGVEDHPDYHRPTDDAERVDPSFFAAAVATVVAAVERFDAALGEIESAAVSTR